MKKIIIETDFIGKIEFSKIKIKKVSGNIFRSIFFAVIKILTLNKEEYDKKYDAILIIKRCKDT